MDIKNIIKTLDSISENDTKQQIILPNDKTLLTETSSGGSSSAGSVASNISAVETSIMPVQRRVKKDNKSKVKVDEEEINEEDLLVAPSTIKKQNGFTPRSQVRTDHEVSMAVSDLLQCGKNAEIIYNILRGISEEQGIPGWVQEKITKSSDYLNTVAEYMEGEYKRYIEHNHLNDDGPRGGYGVIAGGTTMEEETVHNVFHDTGKPAEPWNTIDRIAGKKTMEESVNTRWEGIGFSVRSDYLWPSMLLEDNNSEKVNKFSKWIDECRESQKVPQKGSKCILAMIVHTGNSILIMNGGATYVGQTPTEYILKIGSGTHKYSKRNQIVFDSEQSFGAFTSFLTLKFGDSDTNIEVKKMPVMEAHNPAQQAAIAINMKKQGKKPKNEDKVEEATVTEKAKSTQQQKFFGMVRAMQKGKKVKGASKELKQAAKDISKKDVKDFAKTKHKGLPTRVDEITTEYENSLSKTLDESIDKLFSNILSENSKIVKKKKSNIKEGMNKLSNSLTEYLGEDWEEYNPEYQPSYDKARHIFNKISMLSSNPVKNNYYYAMVLKIDDNMEMIFGPEVVLYLGKRNGNYVVRTNKDSELPPLQNTEDNSGIIGTIFVSSNQKYELIRHYIKTKFQLTIPAPKLNVNVKANPTNEDAGSTPGGVGGSTKMFLEVGEEGIDDKPKNEPRIRKYTKERPDGSIMTRWEVLDYRGHRAPGQGSEGFDDLGYAKEFLARNKKKLSAPPDANDDEDLNEDLRKWFREKWVRFNPQGKIMGPCARGDDSEGKPKCLPQSKAQSLGKKGRASAAAKKRREDPNPERSGKAINVATKTRKKASEGVDENMEQLDELKCWPGYTRVKGVPQGAPGSCKKKTKEDVEEGSYKPMKCPECGGEMVSEELLNEKKDACYYKVKSRYKIFPSAYASGSLVQCRKKGAKNWGNKSKK